MRDIDQDGAVSMDSLRLALDRSQQRYMPYHKRARRGATPVAAVKDRERKCRSESGEKTTTQAPSGIVSSLTNLGNVRK